VAEVYSGKLGGLDVDGVTWDADEYTYTMENDGPLPDVTTYRTNGCSANLDGVDKASLTFRGPYNVGAVQAAKGSVHAFRMRVGPGLGFSMTGRISQMKIDHKVKDTGRLSMTVESTGPFVPILL
jgi:hypothetical protein